MKVTKHGDLFGEIELWLESPYLEKPIKGLGSYLEAAQDDFERQIVIEMRIILRKLKIVYQKTKYYFNPLECQQVLDQLEDTLKRINRRTSLLKAQERFKAIYFSIESVLPHPGAKTFSSQLRKIDLIGEFIDFNFSNWVSPNIKNTL